MTTTIVTSLILIITVIHLTTSYNLSPKFHIIISDPSQQEGSYFGYSVHLRSGIDRYASSIVIGAPKANSTYTEHRQISEPGVVYQCNIDEFIDFIPVCYPLLLDPTGEVKDSQKIRLRHKKSHSFLGAALDGQTSRGGRFVACAPRCVTQYNSDSKKFLRNNGMCYWISDTTNANQTAIQLSLLQTPNLQRYKGKTRRYYGYIFGEAGFSVHMPKADGSEILLGAPGVFHWKGGIVRYKDSYTDSKDSNIIPYYDVITPNTFHNSRITFDSLFGYSLSSGIFLSDFPTKRWYVGGAPKDGEYNGRVFLFDLRDNNVISKQEIVIKKEFDGKQLGEYFGSSVCVTDVNADGLDDVLIGAPRNSLDSETLETGDEGAVYVFLNADFWNFQEQHKLEHSLKSRAEFGLCISPLGDLDLDGYNDVAVGAPYEDDGRGAIYIYLGSSKGLKTKPSQHIRAKEVDHNLFGFGFSISKGVDIDKNYYNDLVVGSYLSGHIVLFRAQPVVRLSGKIVPSEKEIGLNITELIVDVCVIYNGIYLPKMLQIFIDVQADPIYKRATFTDNSETIKNNLQKIIDVELGNEVCIKIPMEIKILPQDFSKPLEFRMQYFVHENKSKTVSSFCSSCPVIEPASQNIVNTFIPYATGCGNDKKCAPDLRIIARFLNISDDFVIGTGSRIFLSMAVINAGEPAFLTRLVFTTMDELGFVQIPTFCSDDQVQPIVCDLGSILSGEEKIFIFEIDALKFKPGMKTVTVNLTLLSAGEEKNETDNNKVLVLSLITVAELKITSKSTPEHLSFKDDKGVVISNITSITQEYVIQNLGPSPLSKSIVYFYIPISYDNITMFNVMEPENSIGIQSISCNASWPGFSEDNTAEKDDALSSEFSQIRLRREKNEINYDNLKEFQSIKNTMNVSSENEFPLNRTLLLNCSENLTGCMIVMCELGLLNSQNNAVIKMIIQPMLENLDQVLKNKDILHMDVKAVVKPLVKVELPNNGAVTTILGCTLIGSLPAEVIPHFWIALAVALGLLFLFFLTSGLIKFGFFKRTLKGELELLKEQSFEYQERTEF